MQSAKVFATKLWVQHAKCMSFINLGWTCDLWFFATKFDCKVSTIFSYSLHGLLFFYPPCFKCSSLAMHHACNVFCEVRMWAWFEVWIMNTFYEAWTCKVKGSLAVVIVFEAFSFIDFLISYVLFLVVCNVDPSLSLVTLVVSKTFSFANPYVSNVLSFVVSIIDPTFSLATLIISEAFYFISSIAEPTFSFAFPTFSWTFSAVSLVFCYIVPKNSTTFYFNCSKIEPTLESYSSWATSYWVSSFLASSFLCGFSYDFPKVEATQLVTWQVFSLVAWADLDTFWVVVSFASLALSFAVFYEVEGFKSEVWGWSSKV